jgi:hypothetical protein
MLLRSNVSSVLVTDTASPRVTQSPLAGRATRLSGISLRVSVRAAATRPLVIFWPEST